MIYLVDPVYNPQFRSSINSSTKLAPGITCAKFLGSPGTRTQFEQISADRTQVARNLYLHAQAMRAIIENSDFNNHRIIVAEGIYKPAQYETPSGINELKQDGRAVVYQLIGKDGKIDHRKSYDLALYWKDFLKFDKLVLDYDTYDPNGELSTQIVLIMPMVNETFDIAFKREVETVYNGKLQSKNELLEILI